MRSFLAIGLGFVAGSAMTVLVGTARAEPMPGSAAAEALARAQMAEIHADAARARAAELAKAGGWPFVA